MSSIERQLSAYEPSEMMFIGHGIHQDLNVLLEATGKRIDGDSAVIDTMRLERAYSRRVNGKSRNLGDICEDLDIPYYASHKMHNAGNDAFFAMAIFAEMCCLPD
jgi:DNA polymerase III alpha subunit (gram-positive type)